MTFVVDRVLKPIIYLSSITLGEVTKSITYSGRAGGSTAVALLKKGNPIFLQRINQYKNTTDICIFVSVCIPEGKIFEFLVKRFLLDHTRNNATEFAARSVLFGGQHVPLTPVALLQVRGGVRSSGLQHEQFPWSGTGWH